MIGRSPTAPRRLGQAARCGLRSGRVRTRADSSGVYFARLTADDGRVGFAPFVLRPSAPGAGRVAAVIPTNTWQAYNFGDADGDGWGDTWYAGGSPPVLLDRPFLARGVPPRFKHHDRFFLQWAARSGKRIDFLADDDLERAPSGDELRRLYDLVIFPGHSEYMTKRAYDVVTRYRDLGGNLVFLSANSFFWCVRKRGNAMQRHRLWRELGRPEGALIGTQYRTAAGARVFAAGALDFGGSVMFEPMRTMLDNVWERLAPLSPGL